ncbi:hypothetical protein L484_013936 [Morus notabilis]|uniref:Uncharacterized protein n=1 Tax=Morus notabilis TaxID=981085 RepID=W9QJ63_9ROSA|nr:hypothetical protein L484_013936 [Morus notabilis]
MSFYGIAGPMAITLCGLRLSNPPLLPPVSRTSEPIILSCHVDIRGVSPLVMSYSWVVLTVNKRHF